MGARRTAVNFVLKGLINILCKVDNREFFEKLSKTSPMLIVTNHTNFLEVPIMVTHSYPICLTGLIKSETWNNPIFAFLFDSYSSIPIERGGMFRESFQQVKNTIDKGYFVAVAPEGTRSKTGVLQKGKAGIVHLALDIDMAILPVVHFGGEHIWNNMKHFRRTPFCFKVGQPFKIKLGGRPDREVREEILSEIMGQIAKLLPEEMRGVYSAQAESSCRYLEFL